MNTQRATSPVHLLHTAAALFLLLSAATALATEAGVFYAYTLLGEGGQAIARVITDQESCPTISIDGKTMQMQVRADKGTIPLRPSAQKNGKPAAFPVLSCEAPLPIHTRHASVNAQALPLPVAHPKRIVIIGDTGCRMKASEHAFQACNDTDVWPFAKIAALAATHKPDMVVHVGDYHYRESPCPEGNSGCQNSPWGYGFDVWQADVFEPADVLMRVAPWIAIRGNHESCARAGQGWFRFLDIHAYSTERNCDDPSKDMAADFTEPFAVPLGHATQMIAFDSSKTAGKPYAADSAEFKRYQELLGQVDALADNPKQRSIFVSHHPILGLAATEDGAIQPGNQGLQSVMSAMHGDRLFAQHIDLAVHGHVHQFQAISFASTHPATFVGGNSGSDLAHPLPAVLPAETAPAPGAVIAQFLTQADFGFMTMEWRAKGWTFTEWDRNGVALVECLWHHDKLACTDKRAATY